MWTYAFGTWPNNDYSDKWTKGTDVRALVPRNA
jgi:hypothetical protein